MYGEIASVTLMLVSISLQRHSSPADARNQKCGNVTLQTALINNNSLCAWQLCDAVYQIGEPFPSYLLRSLQGGSYHCCWLGGSAVAIPHPLSINCCGSKISYAVGVG